MRSRIPHVRIGKPLRDTNRLLRLERPADGTAPENFGQRIRALGCGNNRHSRQGIQQTCSVFVPLPFDALLLGERFVEMRLNLVQHCSSVRACRRQAFLPFRDSARQFPLLFHVRV